jgi:hypothetical protein
MATSGGGNRSRGSEQRLKRTESAKQAAPARAGEAANRGEKTLAIGFNAG